ncbi:probable serine/threonine-protein kinase DDB_G0282963 isoform X2 [Panonychus citri]|uniref:probable serine/threonine-protein kinase DDB_G0282963 isoform X2 n=1 Tax=Panonychus citri TaxID=50023 RepID=UPI002307FE05|nr:probable serine/threonine-protein kinase DDB_G0282963 isoform X2 [Panonychus citri]
MKNGHFTRKVKNKTTTSSKDNQPMVTTENNVHNAWTSVKQLTNALRYFQDAVEKEIHNQLPGASSILLDIVVSCYTELGAYLINKDRNAKMLSATDRVYLSLAELMRWSDRVLIEETSNYDRDEVIKIVSNLKESVNTLVQLCIDHYQSRDNLVKSSTSFSLKNDETYGNNNNNNNDEENDVNNKTNGNTQVKPDTINGTINVARKATNNHSDHFSLSHHRNSLPELNPIQSKITSSSCSSSSSSSSGTTPSTVKTCNIRHQPISVTSVTPSTTITHPVGISTFTNKLTSTYNDHGGENLTDGQQQQFNNNLTGYPTISGIYKKTLSSSSTASCSEKFPHSLSTDSLLNSSKFNDHPKMNIPQNGNNNNNNNSQCNFNLPGGKRGGMIVNNAINFPIQFTNCNQINPVTNSCISTCSSSSSTTGGCGNNTNYPDLSDIPPPLPPKKKLSSDLIKIAPKRPSLVNQNSTEFNQPDSSSKPTTAFNCHSHHAMSLESFSNLMISDCNDLLTLTSSTGQDTSHHDYHTQIPDIDDSSQKVYSSRTSKTTTRTIIQQQSDRPAINVIRDSMSSKDGQSINNEDLFPLPSELLINTDIYDYASGQSSPPELPVKLRRRNQQQQQLTITTDEIVRPPSQYDNISDFDSTSISTPTSTNNNSVYKYDWSASTWQSTNHSISCPLHLSRQAESMSSNGGHSTNSNYGIDEDDDNYGGDHHLYEDFTKPPPLPPKQRNIMTYMTMLNNGKTYDGPNDAVLNIYRHSVHTYHLINSASKLYSWQQLESTFNSQMKKISSTTIESDDSIPSLESNTETSSSAANISYERISTSDHEDKPPSLPPKAKSQIHLQQQQLISQQHHYNHNLNHYQQQFILPPPPPLHELQQLTQFGDNQQIKSQFPESQQVNENSIGNLQIDDTEFHELELPPPPPPPPLLPELKPPPSSPPKTSSTVVPSSQSGVSSQSESIRTTDECSGPLDEIDVSPYLVYKNPDDDGPEIRGGIVDVLIVKATEVSKNDFLFQEAFLTTYRTFINPMELINKLIYRHNKFTNCTDSKQRAAKNSFALLVRVVDDLCVSDCSDLLMQTLLEFIYSLVIKGDLAFARVLRGKVIEKFDNRRNGGLVVTNQILLPSINVSAKHLTLHSFKSEIVAEQMTLVDAGLFQKVEVAEYLLWAREQKEELIPNLNKFTEHFNKMSYWARSRIVEIEDPKEREKLVTKFIKIMKHLRKMNNFNSYLALLSALDSGPVRRLEWPKSITESLKDLCSLIDSSSSFRAYRQALAETQPPCIPYIGLILQDLTFVHIGNSDFLSDSAGNNINFAKRWQIFNILDQMRRFKNSHYPFKKNEQVLTFFNDFDNFLCEEAIWQISETIKPRINGSSNVNSSPEKSTTSTSTKK